MRHSDWRRYLAPAAFLLAVTIAVVLIRVGLESGGSTRAPTTTAAKHAKPAKRYWKVRAGDTPLVELLGEIRSLDQMRSQGALSDDEFAKRRRFVLDRI